MVEPGALAPAVMVEVGAPALAVMVEPRAPAPAVMVEPGAPAHAVMVEPGAPAPAVVVAAGAPALAIMVEVGAPAPAVMVEAGAPALAIMVEPGAPALAIMVEPGAPAQHEPDGARLLLEHSVDPRVARCCLSHARWAEMDCSLEELVVALADKVWKRTRHVKLERRVIEAVAGKLDRGFWDLFVELDTTDTTFEEVAAGGTERLARSTSR